MTENIVPVNVVTAERGTIEEKINFLEILKVSGKSKSIP